MRDVDEAAKALAERLNSLLRKIEVDEAVAIHEERITEPWTRQWKRLTNIKARYERMEP